VKDARTSLIRNIARSRARATGADRLRVVAGPDHLQVAQLKGHARRLLGGGGKIALSATKPQLVFRPFQIG
jgi:hypothetical protein